MFPQAPVKSSLKLWWPRTFSRGEISREREREREREGEREERGREITHTDEGVQRCVGDNNGGGGGAIK